MLQSGDQAPLFSLPDADMETFDLASALGQQTLVIYFYPRDNTPGCTRQATDFSDRESDFAKLNCAIVGISPDDSLTHSEFRDEHGISVRLLADTENEVSTLYGVWREKEVDGVRRMGIVRSTFVIDREGVIVHALYDVVPRGHAAEVYQLIRQLEPANAKSNRQEQRRNA